MCEQVTLIFPFLTGPWTEFFCKYYCALLIWREATRVHTERTGIPNKPLYFQKKPRTPVNIKVTLQKNKPKVAHDGQTWHQREGSAPILIRLG